PRMSARTLFVSTYAPVLENGRDLRTYTVVRALAQLGPVDVMYVSHTGQPVAPQFAAAEGVELHEVVPSRGLRRGVMYASKLAQAMPNLVARSCSPEVLEATERLAGAPGRGAIVAGDINAMVILMAFARRTPVIFNTHNIESSYVPGSLRQHVQVRELALLERRVLRRASEAWMVSRRDVEEARRLAPGAALRYAPNVADVASIVPEPARSTPGDTIMMVADFTYFPNMSGLDWLVDEVLPAVWARRPSARLRLCGRGLDPARFAAVPQVEVQGFVERLGDAYAGAAVVAVPLTEGAGTPLKFVEALAYGVPIVATPVAARGLDAVAGAHFRLGADALGFADELVDLLERGDVQMVARARALAEAEYSVEALARHLAPALDGAASA
ncbi:MAG: glycosyl transferase, partial [Conexibacter sp.]|nr:glycosyl transferase [Conexibacter sp.]